jgi:hypothetical protein
VLRVRKDLAQARKKANGFCHSRPVLLSLGHTPQEMLIEKVLD